MKRYFTAAAFLPFRERLFRTLWIAAFISNIGTWMQNVGVSWLAATMSASPLMISLIQTASSLPALLFSYPAGVISDQSDRRRLLLWLQAFLFAVVLALSVLSQLNRLNINLLLLFTFLIGIGAAFTTPVWQAITPEIVSKPQLKNAIALNGVNFNLARAIGPALGGIILTVGGIRSVFLFNSVSFLALMAGIYMWHNAYVAAGSRVSFRRSAAEGLRAVRLSKPFLWLLLRTISFTAFVSIVFAFLPQLSKYKWKQDSAQYTWLWVFMGIGAMTGSYLYGLVNQKISAGKIVLISCELVAVCLFLLTKTNSFYLLNCIMFFTGIGWINATSTLNVLAQQYSPGALKGRFLAVNVTVFQGSIALSSVFWGYLSNMFTPLLVMKIAAFSMAVLCGVLALFPMEEDPVAENSVACSDALLQYQLK
ncbi:MFS transporter [Chitinophagaceae bacterium MMS25-I14]